MALECEAKIKINDPERVRARLAELGAEFEGEGLERNWVLDDAAGSLFAREILLRVRSVDNGGGGAVVTVKRKTAGPGAFKTREEVESRADSAQAVLEQLGMLGFSTVWRYEKFRAIWRRGGCVVTLDAVPELGDYTEIEGPAERIPVVARELGLDPDSHIDDSYLGIWVKYLEARGEARRHMIFSPPGGGTHSKGTP